MINDVRLMGYFGADPQVDNLSNGSKKVRFPLSLHRRGSKSGNFVQCEGWNGTADIIMEHGKKGTRVMVEAELRVDVWKTPEGETRSKTYVNINRIIFLDIRFSSPTINNETQNMSVNNNPLGVNTTPRHTYNQNQNQVQNQNHQNQYQNLNQMNSHNPSPSLNQPNNHANNTQNQSNRNDGRPPNQNPFPPPQSTPSTNNTNNPFGGTDELNLNSIFDGIDI